MLYLAGVLVVLILSIWRYSLKFPLNTGASAEKAEYVLMGSGSQAVLQMDPRRSQLHSAPTDGDSNPPSSKF
jgi:hypothetical protein